ncbi:Immunoglobulin I-set domain family protein [Acanthocheilonema viteae]
MNLASLRQRQYQRKYNSYRKYTATEDVNYSAHTSRSSYRSESITSRSSDRGRSSSSEIVSATETRSLPVYIATQDYNPEPDDIESISLEQGQIVEVLDKKNAASWLIRTKARPPKSGWVPGSYFESPTEYYKQRKKTRELVNRDLNLTDEQEAIMKRDQVYHDLLRSEEEFVNELRTVVDTYVKALDDANIPEEVKAKKDELIMNLKQLHNFHANIMLKGLQYYSDDPNKVGQTFTRLSRDFDLHIQFHHNLPHVQKLLEQKTINDFLEDLSNKIEAGAKTFQEHLQNVADRIVQYQNYFKEFVKYASRAKLDTKTMQKALELMMSVPERVTDMAYIRNIEQYPGDLNKLGRLYRHDSFLVWEGEQEPTERYLFLFKNKLMFTDKNNSKDVPSYKHYATIRLDKYKIRISETEPDIFELEPNEPGLPEFQIRAKDVQSMEFVWQAWLKDMNEMKERNEHDMEVETISELDMTMSDARSEFSEYSTISRSLFGPEEGPPRKKIKSPPVISPTASTTSLYSGGSSSIDWTTTGTTLDMQGTRVTRTQYGFRTLQESSAKMCLKVTGYPLPEITWYKDDQMLHEDERHTFYADEDGFFALTIDPVQVEDTGRYTCMATNEYGQASTSAFFKVLKVEKEAAPPAFVTTLQDQEVKEGEIVSFECEVEGWPEPELVWLVDEQPLRPSHDFKLEYDGQNAKLEIRDAQPEDTGIYSVRIKNEYGSAESKAKLTVEPDPDKNHVAPEFQAVIEDVECNEGDTVKFKAVLTGDPVPEVVWMINGIPLSESDKIKFINEDGICILTITDVSRHFDGTVTCQGVNRLGTRSCDAQLKVRVPPSAPHFERPLEDKISQEEQIIVLETEISGFPDPNVSFMMKGKPIVSGENGIEIINVGNGCYKIEISKANIELHDGEIVCTATNNHGQAESRARIVVEPIDKDSLSAPTFVKDIEDQTVKYGEMAVFETSVRGSPNLEISWFINGQKVDKTTDGIRIEIQSVTDHKLIVDSAKYAGTILCRAENSVGRYETKAKLTVISGEKKKRAPEFIEKLADVNVIEESNAIFEVRIEAEPMAKLKWFLNEKELTESDHIKIREFDGSWKLEMNKVTIEENGIIRCVAENSEGNAETTAHLTVNRKPLAPQFEDRPKNVTVERGQEAQFQAHAIAVPDPIYQWSIGGRKIKETTEGAKVETINGVSTLTIDTKIFDSSTVSVTATNSIGVDETGALLTVQEKEAKEEGTEDLKESGDTTVEKMPVIKKALHDQTVKHGEIANFEVSIEPNEVVAEWYSNGNKLTDGMPGVKISHQNCDFKLTIDSTLYAGVISFKASNKAGKAESSANLIAIQKAPEFLNTLSDISVKEGDNVEVTIESSSNATFEWALNEKTLQSGVGGITIRNEESKSVLIFEKVSLQQAGNIKVTATNEGGQACSSFNMTVTEKDIAPEIVTGPNSLSIKENNTAEFRVEITGKPTPIVKWQLNGRELTSSDANISMKSFEEVYILKIERANVKHAGEVVVTAENTAGMVGKEVVLKVEPDLTKPVFKTHLIDRSVNENEPLRWDIAIERPYKGVTMKWFLNGKELTNNENIQIIDHGEGKYHITINEAKPDMSGTLIAKATNSYGTSESHASVEVKEIARKPEILRQPQNHEVEENQTAKFSAIISGKPIPTVSWYMNGMRLENSSEIGVKFDETTGKTSIKIFKANLSDSGKKITIKAENAEGQVEASANLTVNKKSEPPNILAEMKSRQVNEGETVNFSIKVAGYPTPEVTWFRNGEPIVPGSNIKITEEDGVHTLVFSDVLPEQSGEISCEAKNSVGSKKQLATLTVKPTGSAPFFEKNIADKLVVEGEELIMDAKLAEVKPAPTISWLKDGKPLEDARFKLSREENGVLKLKIDSVELNDKSRITIRAENQFGSADCSASIGVTKKRPMAKPAFLSDIPATTVTEGESLNVKVIITGDPVPFTKWYINDQLVVATEDTEMKKENGVYSLTIHGCTKDMTGTIKCVAYNKAGEATVQGNLTVLTPIPVEFETSLCDAVCREGDTLKLKAVLMGEPTPQVSWYVNGKKLEESQNIKIHAEKGTYTVTIKNITCDYSGKVLCEAVNEYGKAVSEASLLVLPRGEPPDFIEWLSNVKARQGSKVTHKVVFTGDPKPNLTWYINNEEIKNSDEITIVTDDNTSTLVIKNFNQDKHTGEIICKAENDAGEVSCTASMGPYTSDMFSESQTESEAMAEEVLNFEEGPEFGTEADSMEEFQRTPTPIMAPKFITKIKDTRAARGHQAIFECVVPDTKGVCCKWLKDGREIELIARIRVQTRTIEGHVSSELIIDDVVPEDAGKYTVVVENFAGKDSCEATLNVIEVLMKPETYAPEFVVAIQDKTCNEAEEVVFECKVIGEPQPTISWFHEKTPLVEETSKTIIESEGTIQRLVIVSADVVDRGQYICLAENIEGKAESKATLTVLAEAPQFTRHISSKEVSIGEKVILNCSVKGSPQPTVQFFRESTRIISDSHHSIEHDISNVHWRLVIEKAEESDFRKYRAIAINSVGMVESEAIIKEKETNRKPELTEVLKNRKVTEGDEIIMEVKFSGIPLPDVKWFKDSKEIVEEKEKITIKTEKGQSTLIIKNAKPEEAGSYRVELVNSEGKEASSAEVTVESVAVPPKFPEMLTDLEVHELESIEMKVAATGVPTPEIQWFKDGAPVQVDSERVFVRETETGQHILTIKQVQLEDAGVYSCKASNKAGSEECKAKFVVLELQQAPKFTKQLSEITVKEVETAELAVTVSGKPKPEVCWMKNDVPINIDNVHFATKQDENGNYTLVIKEAKLEDGGIYSCKAYNKIGETETKTLFAVEQENELPQFSEGLKEFSVEEGETAELSVTVVGKPTPEIAWYRDGVPVNIDNKAILVKRDDAGHFTLVIKEARLKDAGVYSCKATNVVGSAQTEAKFAVEETVEVPKFIETLQEISVQENETVQLSVTVAGKPIPEVVWLKDGVPVNIDNVHILAKKDEQGHNTLIIKEARLEDMGNYSCKAVNLAGTEETEAKLAVISELIPPSFTDEIGELEIQEGDKAELQCTVIGSPKPMVEWMRNGIVINIDNNHFFKKDDETGKQTLVINNVNEEDFGTYTCVATNSIGTAENVGKIKFPKYGFEKMREEEVKPMFIEPLEAHTVKEGETISIKCRVNENAKANIHWYLGDKLIEPNEHLIVEKLDDGIIKLTIENATKEDVGMYRCEAINKSGKATTAAKLNFATEDMEEIEDESALIGFIQPLSDVIAPANSATELLCALSATKGDVQIQWSKDGSDVLAQHVTIEQLIDGTQKLKIAKVTEEDCGTYRCTASIGDSSAWTEGKLSILETAKKAVQEEGPPEFTELLKSCTVTENAEIVLQCKLKGLPRPTISWMKDGVKLAQNHRMTAEYHEDGTIVLKIKNARKEDSGEYRCDAVNTFGTAWTAGPVRVATESDLQQEGEAPDFIEPIKPVNVSVGEIAILEGKVKGQPTPEIKWFSGENIVKENANIKLENLPDGTQRLIVKKATTEDAGEYRCVASNQYGDVWSDATLAVQVPVSEEEGGMEYTAPTFLKTLERICAKESEHVVLECKIVGEPMPEIKWFKDKKEITANDAHFKNETLPDGTARLIIDSVKKEDGGEFRCEAQNTLGTARTDATLSVLYDFEIPVVSESSPEFAQELKAVEGTEGEQISFECRVVGIPVPQVKWFKDGDEIKPNEHIRIESLPDGTNRLVIDSVNIEDQGNYRCEATNNAGSMSSKAPLTVNELETLKLKKGLTDTIVEVGAKIRLFIEVEGKPKTVKWFRGKDEIKPNKRIKQETIKEHEYSLEIEEAESSDEGTYRVILSTDTETVESCCAVTVFKSEVAPVIRKGLQDKSVPKGSKLALEIELDGTPKQIKWLKNGIPVDDKIMKAKDLGNGKYQLIIDEIKENDAGEYTVQVSNDSGQVESKANITLLADKPEIISGLKPTVAEIGEKVTFEVETKGPIKQVKWYKNGVEAKNVETKQVGDNKYQLIIDKATKNDEADYKVVLSNDGGDAESSAKLTVKLPKIKFTKSLEDQTLDAGTKALLTVEVNLPPKQVKWYKNGKEITVSDKAKSSKLNDSTYQLLIPDTDKDDTAEYKIVVTTDGDDTADSSCALTVKLPALVITKGLADQTVNAGEKVLLNVEVNTPPKLVKWYKNGREIGSNDKAKANKVNDKNYQLEISNATEDDAFDYKVILSNDEGSVESSCMLTVKKPAEKPTIKKGIEDQFIAVEKPLEIAIETTGKPKVVKWYKNGQLLSAEINKTVKEEKIDENNYVLKIEKCTLNDSGTYSVEVQNEAGQAKSSGEITVEDKISFLKPLQDVEVVEAEQAVLMVETNTHPRIVKWYKNGQEMKPISGRIEMKDNTTRFQLIIKKAEIADAADYKVVLSNSAGDANSSAKLTVKKSKGQPKIVKGLEDQVIAKGDELILEIKVEEEPTEVRWLKNDTPLPENIEAKIEKIDEQTYRLTIPQVDSTDAGVYSVEVINEVGKVQSAGSVDVDVKPEITKGLEDCEINEGDEQLFMVETNVPIREVKWYKNGQEIKSSPKVIMKQITSKKFELILTEATLEDTATYKVTLGNKAGTCDSSASLTVSKPDVLKVLDSLKDVEVNEGEPIKLSVKVEGQPKIVKWLKNGQELKSDDRVQITENPETGEYTLTILESLTSDDAAYRVVLSNRFGEVQNGSITRVKPKKAEPVTSVATFVTPLEDVDVPEGDNLTLKCKVSGEPMPALKWYKDGNEITKGDRVVMRMGMDGTATLRILDSKKKDAGRYSVSAINSVGESKSECNVRVLDADELPSAPKFVIPLKDVVTEIGTKAEFNIKVRGIPNPTLHWSIANQNVAELDGVKIEDMGDGNWTMIIENVTEEFIGRIKCVAINENGKAECESQLIQTELKPGKGKIDEGYPPKFNVSLWDRRIPEGQVTTIECHVDAKPTADIVWTKDGATLIESDRIEIRNTPDGACRVRINNFGKDDVGIYKCTASNTFGVADTRSNLTIQMKEQEEVIAKKQFPPRFNPPLVDKFADIDETVRLSCKVDASPKASITWYKDGVPLRNNGRIIIENDDDGNCLLTVNHSTESDDGAYRCVAINDIGSSNSACMVSIRKIKEEVKKEGEEPFFTKGLVDKWLERGEKLILQCTVIGDPKPEIRWYRNGILLRPNNKINIGNTSDGLCTLTIDECAMSDEGIYRCDAENCNGKARTQSTVHIERPIEKLEKKIVEGQAPRFIIPLQDITVYVGSTIDLECKVTGDPMPTAKWSKDGMILRDDSRYQWEIDAAAGTYRLKINDANVNDEGAYRCVATNAAGSATTKSFVRIDDGSFIQKPSSNEPPRFTITLGDARAIEGQPLKLECKIEGTPLTDLVWYKDGERVIPDDRIKIECDSDGRARLIINSCNANDEGLYRVIATNPFGSAHSKATATVKKILEDATNGFMDGEKFDAYRAPRVIVPLENIKVMEDNSFTLRCKFSGDPRPKIKWFRNGERIYSYNHCILTETEDGDCELTVKNAYRFDGGCYRCVAENIYGSDRTICEVAVQLKEKKPQRNFEDEIREGNAPGFSVPLTMKRAKAGDTVILECVPYGKPFPEIKWLKDGIEIEVNDKITIESLDDKTQRIILKDVDFFAEGFYRCVATNEYGTASTKGEIVLEGDRTIPAKKIETLINEEPIESKPRIRRGLYDMSVHQGNTIEMQVCTSGWPTPTVKWFKNGQELKSSGPDGPVVVWTDERGIHHCVILNASLKDEAEYALEATNKLGTAQTEGAITIIKPREVPGYEDDRDRGGLPYPPGFIRQLKNKHVFSHMPTIFDCLVIGYPPPEVEWFHNGKRITPGGRIRIQSCGGGSHALIIMDTLPEDAGEYVAIARNSQGQASSSAVLDVTVPLLDSIKFDGSVDVTPYLTEEYGFKKIPHYYIPTPPDRGPFIKEVTGHYLTLSWIPTKRAPPRYPQVTYVIEIRELPEKDWVLLDYNIPEPVCKVRNLELGKSYQFRVRAENIYGISDPSPASPPSRLMAPPQPVLDKNKRVIPLLDPYAERALDQAHAEQYACAPWFAPGVEEKRFCAENDMLSITLYVSGYPDPNIVWKFRNVDLDMGPTSRIRVLNHAGMETTLIISGFSRENVGQYQCIATNQYGEAQQNILVDLGARPRFIQSLVNKVIPSGKPLRLDVRVEGCPFPELKWMKDWRPIVESSHVSFVREGSLCSLIINDPFWCDCGIYSVAAINDAGTTTTSCSVTIEADGDFSVMHDIRKKKARMTLEARKVREIYEIDENDEKAAAAGAPFHVTEIATQKRFLAQLRALDENLARNIEVQNSLDHPNIIQLHQAIMDQGIAVLIYENANRSLLDSLISSPVKKTEHVTGERQVQVFMKQLLHALKCMHDKKIAHLDIRPEVILLQDDHLRLADFGQSRRLIRGKVIANIMGSPEFVSPEIAAGTPVTLASDLWSVGTLTYVLLSGISPFLGDSDNETVRNVMLGKYRFDIEEFDQISSNAKDFVSKLLVLDPRGRLNIDQALRHPWLSEEFLENAPITSECLREFKYKHKWLERRVFVQQTPTDQLMSTVQTPNVNLIGSNLPQRVQGLARCKPNDIYDYLQIKDRVSPRDVVYENVSKRHLQPQEKGETPSQRLLQQKPRTSTDFFDDTMLPLQLVHGEHREIEEEIANRILSDISEETSVNGSVVSHDEPESLHKISEIQMRQKKSRSKSSTPQVEGFSLDGTSIPSPGGTGSAGASLPEYCSNTDYRYPIQSDPSIPVGAPLFLEGLENHSLVLDDVLLDTRSPRSLPSLPGTKSPVLLSPIREYTMGVVIGTKQGTKGEITISKPQLLEVEKIPEKQTAIERKHEDEFENLMNEIEEMKKRRKKEREEMERLRPKNIYNEDIEFKKPDIDDDEFPWESRYQIGPETLLLATRGAGFNARVRDYRRELWGDGAPLVNQGYLGYRNQDITVRERRRFTDLIREDENIAKSVEILERDMRGSHLGAIRRIRSDISKAIPAATRENGTFGAIFRNRLKDLPFMGNECTVIFKCAVVGNPQPIIEWFFNESLIVDDHKHKIFYENGHCQLTIQMIDITDLGEYSCVASNEHGVDKTSARLIIGDTPAPPGRPEVKLSSDTEVFITWEVPQMSHGLECFMYKLEVRPAGENDHFSEWRLVSDKIEDEAAVVRHLTPQGIYQFRVTAKNEFGWGAPSLTSRIIQTHPKGSPKLQIEKLQEQCRVCVISKPPQTRLISKSKKLGEITEEEDEEKTEVEEIGLKLQTQILTLNVSEEPEKRFQLIAPIPRGRFGEIAFAIDKSRESDADCIAKIRNVNVEGANGTTEFEAMKECQQENIACLIAAYQRNELLFLFMERYQEDIFERFTYRDSYNEEQISRVIVQIASALHWMHFRGYVHMDVQATNVLFSSRQSWQIKLTDFASAQKISNEIKQPLKPNLYWTSPEILRTDEKKVPITGQTDIWSLGVITFCLLSGFHPFASADDSDDEIKESIIYQKCNPNLIQVQATEESLKFVTWALKKDPMRRMRTDEALAHRWLSMDSVMIRRRETVNYPSSRLRKTAILTGNRPKIIHH